MIRIHRGRWRPEAQKLIAQIADRCDVRKRNDGKRLKMIEKIGITNTDPMGHYNSSISNPSPGRHNANNKLRLNDSVKNQFLDILLVGCQPCLGYSLDCNHLSHRVFSGPFVEIGFRVGGNRIQCWLLCDIFIRSHIWSVSKPKAMEVRASPVAIGWNYDNNSIIFLFGYSMLVFR